MGFAPELAESQGNGLSRLAILGQTEKILASEVFSRSERLAAFLRFTVIETLAGRGNTLKEQVIAASVYLDRPDLRAGNSAAVRSDARRLRDKLREYYAEFSLDPIVISLQKGSYAPGFVRNAALEPALEATPPAIPESG